MTYYFIPLIIFVFFIINNFSTVSIPKPYLFVSDTLQSNLSHIITEINSLLPQLSDFICQFNNLVANTGINVITDSVGNMSIDIPHNMPDYFANNLNTRIGIIDRLINTRGQEINDLLQKGLELEKDFKAENPNYISQLTNKIKEFERLKTSYKH